MFLHLSVSHSVHRGSTWAGTPPGQVHPRAGTSPGRYNPRQVHPLAGTPPAGTPPRQVHPPGQVNPPGRYTPQGRYTPRAGTPPNSACWDTVNKRRVRILLECILVYSTIFTQPPASQLHWLRLLPFKWNGKCPSIGSEWETGGQNILQIAFWLLVAG